MLSLITVAKTQEKIAKNVSLQRLAMELTQQGLVQALCCAVTDLT